MKESKQHPSYGLIQFSRVNGGKPNFFGSEIQPDSYICLTIAQAEEEKDLGKSWYFPRKRIIEVQMTNTQFAELITSLNMGSGVPCTITQLNGQGVEQETSREYKVNFHKRRMKENSDAFIKDIKNRLEELDQICSKLAKKDQEEVKKISSFVSMQMDQNFPWYIKQFYEEMENIAQDIKSNMEADIIHKIQNIGFQNISENRLIGPTEYE